MLTGQFIWWSEAKGYGLILSGETKYFAHIMRLTAGSRLPKAGYSCEFEASTRPKRKPQNMPEADCINVLAVQL
jgi:cold shock CspA family protein